MTSATIVVVCNIGLNNARGDLLTWLMLVGWHWLMRLIATPVSLSKLALTNLSIQEAEAWEKPVNDPRKKPMGSRAATEMQEVLPELNPDLRLGSAVTSSQ